MAIFTDPPTQLPEYCTDDTPVIDPISGEPNLKEPNQSVKDNGDTPFGVRPKRNFANWRDHHSYKQHEWAKDSFYTDTVQNHNSLQVLNRINNGGVYTEYGSFAANNTSVLNIGNIGCIMWSRTDPSELISIPVLPAANKDAGITWQDNLNGGGRIDGIDSNQWLNCHAVLKDYNTPSQKIEYVFDDGFVNSPNLDSWMSNNGYTHSKFIFAFPYVNGTFGLPATPIIPAFTYRDDWVLWHEVSNISSQYTASEPVSVEGYTMRLSGDVPFPKFPYYQTEIKMSIYTTQDRGVYIYPTAISSGPAIRIDSYQGSTFVETFIDNNNNFRHVRNGSQDSTYFMAHQGYKNPLKVNLLF